MNKQLPFFQSLLITTWLGGLWVVGYLAIPTLFYAQDDRVLAGLLAGKILAKMGWLSIVCGSLLLISFWLQQGKSIFRSQLFWCTTSMLIIALILQFGLQPAIAEIKKHSIQIEPYASQFKQLHGISSVLYLTQSLVGLALLYFQPRSN